MLTAVGNIILLVPRITGQMDTCVITIINNTPVFIVLLEVAFSIMSFCASNCAGKIDHRWHNFKIASQINVSERCQWGHLHQSQDQAIKDDGGYHCLSRVYESILTNVVYLLCEIWICCCCLYLYVLDSSMIILIVINCVSCVVLVVLM